MDSYSGILRLSDEQDKSAELYDVYQQRLTMFITSTVEVNLRKKRASYGSDSREFLQEYCSQWKKFTIYVFTLKKQFDYLDRYFLKNAG